MSNSAPLPKILPDTEHEFSIDLEGETTKTSYSGTFKSRIPNLKMRAAVLKKQEELTGGVTEDIILNNMTYMISHLRATLVEMPDWWKNADYGYELFDLNVVSEVYKKVTDFEEDWKNLIWGPKDSDVEEKDK